MEHLNFPSREQGMFSWPVNIHGAWFKIDKAYDRAATIIRDNLMWQHAAITLISFLQRFINLLFLFSPHLTTVILRAGMP